jgi:phospholipid-binding lipoprotein MlaA
MNRSFFRSMLLGLLAVLAVGGCAHHPADDPADPLEGFNRKVWAVNKFGYDYVLTPVATRYVHYFPGWTRTGVNNFFDNLVYPRTIINDALQGKFRRSFKDTGRFVVNTVYGIGGVIDVGTRVGLERHDEDFGQTLGVWGVGEGWFLMLPFFGPSDNRDLVGFAGDYFSSLTTYIPADYDWLDISLTAMKLVNERANLLPTDSLLNAQFDQYLFIRTAYLQRRQAQIYDGNPPPEDLGFSDSDDDSSSSRKPPPKKSDQPKPP